jgi:hypothetical protein
MAKKVRKDVGKWPGRKVRPGERADLQLTVSKSYSGTLELTPNGGHLISMERGVHNAETQTCVPAGVPAADH